MATIPRSLAETRLNRHRPVRRFILGNLLCAVANVLNGPGGGLSNALNQIDNLLNRILGAL
jgi:hypothetical protein